MLASDLPGLGAPRDSLNSELAPDRALQEMAVLDSKEDLDAIRSRIDAVDRRILEALASRRALVEDVVRA